MNVGKARRVTATRLNTDNKTTEAQAFKIARLDEECQPNMPFISSHPLDQPGVVFPRVPYLTRRERDEGVRRREGKKSNNDTDTSHKKGKYVKCFRA